MILPSGDDRLMRRTCRPARRRPASVTRKSPGNYGYDTALWWTAGIFAGSAVIAGAMLRPGPLDQQGTPSQAHAGVPAAPAKAGREGASDRSFPPARCGCNMHGLDDLAAADGPVRRAAAPGHRVAAVGRGNSPDPGLHQGSVRRPSARTHRIAGRRSPQAPRGRAVAAEDRHTPRDRLAANRWPPEPQRPEQVLNQHIHACTWSIGSAVLRPRESPGSGDASSPAWRPRW